jgi:hypothetical protein
VLPGSCDFGLQGVALAVLGAFGVKALYAVQHLVVHGGQDEPAAPELGPVAHQGFVVEVVPASLLLVVALVVALADKKVGFAGMLRLSRSKVMPYQLSRSGFRYRRPSSHLESVGSRPHGEGAP